MMKTMKTKASVNRKLQVIRKKIDLSVCDIKISLDKYIYNGINVSLYF